MTEEAYIQLEKTKCKPTDPARKKPHLNVNACVYFVNTYVKIHDKTSRKWIPFKLWPAQVELLEHLMTNGRVCVLKGRQLGITWLCLSYALWLIVCMDGGVSIALYSLTTKEAEDLLRKLRGMFDQLPWWIREHIEIVESTKELWIFNNDTTCRAMSTERGDSYQFTFGLVDEASLVLDLEDLLIRLEPALNSVDKSTMALISRANKDAPESEFNDIYRLGQENKKNPNRFWDDWVSYFLPWWENPTVTPEWYENQKQQQLKKKKHLDVLFTSYPATDAEALAPNTANKRILRGWVVGPNGSYAKMDEIENAGLLIDDLISVELIRVYHMPVPGRKYSIGVDCAEGLPTSDNSAIIVVDMETGEECATVCGKITPRDTAHDANVLSLFYNKAGILVERNNHGHTVIEKLYDFDGIILEGPDERDGYNATTKSKVHLFNELSQILKQIVWEREHLESLLSRKKIKTVKNVPQIIHSWDVALEIMSIERKTLRAPEGQHDDMADAFALAQMARSLDLVPGVQRAEYWSF